MTKTILQGIVGSTAYGLAREGSDIDRMAVFVAPTLDIAGLDWSSSNDSKVDQGPEGDDFSSHEVGKFVRLALKANPTITELMWLDNYEIVDPLGQKLISARKLFLSSKAVRSAYLGYASAQFHKFATSGIKKRKHARHCLRLLRQGHDILTNGYVTVKVADPSEYFALDNMTDDQVTDRLQKEFDLVDNSIKSMTYFAVPDEPDRLEISLLLREIRRECLY